MSGNNPYPTPVVDPLFDMINHHPLAETLRKRDRLRDNMMMTRKLPLHISAIKSYSPIYAHMKACDEEQPSWMNEISNLLGIRRPK